MTYGDLIVYIIQNNLVNEEVFQNGKLAGFISIPEAAVKFGVGESTVRAWICMGTINYIQFNGLVLIPQNVENPMERKTDEKTTTNPKCVPADNHDDRSKQLTVTGKGIGRIHFI